MCLDWIRYLPELCRARNGELHVSGVRCHPSCDYPFQTEGLVIVEVDDLLKCIKKYKHIHYNEYKEKQMEEKIKLLEMQIQVLQGTVNKMDQALGLLFQVLAAEKAIFDQLQINKPAVEEKK